MPAVARSATRIARRHPAALPTLPAPEPHLSQETHPSARRSRWPIRCPRASAGDARADHEGFSYDEIAELMQVSRNTVMTFVRRIYQKLEVGSKAEAIFEARSYGLL